VTAKYGIHGSHKLQILHLGQFIYKHTHTNHALNASEAWSNSSEEEITLEEEKFATQTQVSSTNVLLFLVADAFLPQVQNQLVKSLVYICRKFSSFSQIS
jgi:hypothetical protein